LWLFCKSQALSTDRNEVMVCFFIEFLLVCVYVMIFMYICEIILKQTGMKNLPIGIQSFEDLRNNDYLYVEKVKIWILRFHRHINLRVTSLKR
jgi:hypothetical protein